MTREICTGRARECKENMSSTKNLVSWRRAMLFLSDNLVFVVDVFHILFEPVPADCVSIAAARP
jgi:hypothetical protein